MRYGRRTATSRLLPILSDTLSVAPELEKQNLDRRARLVRVPLARMDASLIRNSEDAPRA